MIITSIIKNHFNLDPVITSILCGVFEITRGIVEVSSLASFELKLTITLFILLFGSLSIIFQSISILSDYKINIKRILIIKLVFSLITSFIFYLLITTSVII